MPASEVARIRKQIDDELNAMRQGLSGIAETGKHTFITKKYESLSQHQETLAHEIGYDAATQYVCQEYIRIIK